MRSNKALLNKRFSHGSNIDIAVRNSYTKYICLIFLTISFNTPITAHLNFVKKYGCHKEIQLHYLSTSYPNLAQLMLSWPCSRF
ncbi:hypothetical protein X975_05830, partial [Stegodyphus mimosarum]